jgi:hypothetical protein
MEVEKMETKELRSWIFISLILTSLVLMISVHGGQIRSIVHANNSQSTYFTPPSIEWNKNYGVGTSPLCGIQSEDGGYAIVGSIQLSEGTTGYFIKTDSSGNVQWNQTYKGITQIHSILQTSDGAYSLAGSIDSSVSNFWLARTDSLGYMQWNRTYSGTGDSYAKSLIKTTDGGYALIGNTDLNSSIPVAGGFDIWVVKTDSEGNLQWNQTFGGLGYDEGCLIIQTEDGGYLILADLHGHDMSLIKLESPTQISNLQMSDIVLYMVIAIVSILILVVVATILFKRKNID